MRILVYGKLLALLAAFTQLGLSQSSLASRVLVVYNSADPNSNAVATHYQSARGVPAANMCSISAPATPSVSYSDYVNLIRNPVRTCLNNVGAQNILYIVLAYLRPFTVSTTNLNYAVDSYLEDIWDQYTTQFFTIPPAVHRYYAESQSEGNSFIPFQSLAAYRALPRAQTIYSVWRLDGATPAIAEAQVDSALAATAGGGPPISQVAGSPANACIDMTYSPLPLPDFNYATANWDLYRVAGFLTAANNLNVVTDTLATSFGVSPSPDCLNTGLYVGWYNYATYNNAFSWDKGSIGWDLDSIAMGDPRSGPDWGTNAIALGITATSGAMAEPYLEGIARPAVMLSLLEGANLGDAFLRNTRWLKWMIVNVGDPLYQPFPGGVASVNTALAVPSASVFLNQSTFRTYVGGVPVGVNISLPSPAPSGGLTMALSTNLAGLNVPSSVTIPAGQSNAIVNVTTNSVTAEADVVLTATAGSITSANTLSVYPLLSGVGFPASSAVGGSTINAAAQLNGNAPIGGVVVQLSSDTPSVVPVPASITIPAGLAQSAFTITTAPVTTTTTVNITSTYAGATNTATLTITP